MRAAAGRVRIGVLVWGLSTLACDAAVDSPQAQPVRSRALEPPALDEPTPNGTGGIPAAEESFAREPRVRCPKGLNVIRGTPGDDVLVGTDRHDCILGLGGNDDIRGGDGNDFLYGGRGNDHLVGGAGNDVLVGGRGDDRLVGGEGADVLEGGGGNDVLVGADAADLIRGSAGNDLLMGGGALPGEAPTHGTACRGGDCTQRDAHTLERAPRYVRPRMPRRSRYRDGKRSRFSTRSRRPRFSPTSEY